MEVIMKKTLSIVMVFFTLCAMLVAQPASETTAAKESASAVRTVTVTDMSGDTVTVEGEVKSIINLWPAGTSSFFVMGAGSLVDGLAVNNPGTVNNWAELFYPGASNIPSLGGTTPAIEELAALDPDLVIVHPMTAKTGFAQQIRDMGIPAVNINFSDYESMMTAYTFLGEILGGVYKERLDSWCEMIVAKQAEISALTAGIENRPVVYYIGGQSDSLTTTMGQNSICADWTETAGGIYLSSLTSSPTSTELTAEEIFTIDPDVIIVGGTWQRTLMEELETKEGWKELKAVKNGRVYGNPYGAFAWDRFGLESYFQLEYALMCIQPGIAEANGINRDHMIGEILDFYSMMGIGLTQAQAENMFDVLEPDGSMPKAASGGPGQGMSGTTGSGR